MGPERPDSAVTRGTDRVKSATRNGLRGVLTQKYVNIFAYTF